MPPFSADSARDSTSRLSSASTSNDKPPLFARLLSLHSHEYVLRLKLSAVLDDTDRDAFDLECTDVRRLSRIHLEDIIRQNDGTPLKMHVLKSSANDASQWWGDTFLQAIDSQSPPFATSQINAEPYYCFDVCISCATLHSDIKAGFISESQFRELYKRNEGFNLTIRGRKPVKLTISWRQVLHYSKSILFFETLGPYTS
jgi:hypothetical protein